MTARAYTVATLAERWECSEGVVRKLIRDGRLVHFNVGALIRINPEEVARFECQNIPSNDSEADMPSSTETLEEDDTGSDFEPRTALGLKRKRDGDGQRGATILHGRWGG